MLCQIADSVSLFRIRVYDFGEMTPKETLSTRVPAWLDEELRGRWAEWDVGPSEGLRQILREWWAREELADVTFRDNLKGREAALDGGPEVWKVRLLQRRYDSDRDALVDHFGGLLTPEAIESADRLYRRFPGPVDSRIATHQQAAGRVRRLDPPAVPVGEVLVGIELHAAVAVRLRDRGLPARHLSELESPPASTREQLERVRGTDRVCVSADYAEIGRALQGIGGVGAPVAVLADSVDLAAPTDVATVIVAWWDGANEGRLPGWIPADGGV